jgi:hypothetical protein
MTTDPGGEGESAARPAVDKDRLAPNWMARWTPALVAVVIVVVVVIVALSS